MEAVLKRHRQEQRELQGRITQKKKNATKKTRKGVNDECAELERQQKERQQQEIAALDPNRAAQEPSEDLEGIPEPEGTQDTVDRLASQLNGTTVGASQESSEAPAKKPSRQKARLARRAAEQEAAAAQAAEEAANLPDQRAQEREVMQREVTKRGLVEQEVRSDGHCMYAAVADQLAQAEVSLQKDNLAEYQAVRRDAATFISEHPDDFAPFLEEPLDEYVHKIRSTAEWGGQLELSALARTYDIQIQVLQGDGRVETISPHDAKAEKEIWLAYYRHSFGLGEHYNSLRKKSP